MYVVVVPGWRDGAHCGAMPLVPWAQATTRYPPAGGGMWGTSTVPVTAIGRPWVFSDTYMIR